METQDEDNHTDTLVQRYESQLSSMQEQMLSVTQERDEWREKYQCEAQNNHTLEMEDEVLRKELVATQNELSEIKDQLSVAQNIVRELQMEKTIQNSVVSTLEYSRNEASNLESKLVKEQEYAKQLSSRLSTSIQETKRYRDALEHNDDALRRKEESTKHAVDALHQKIGEMQSENDDLKKELVRYELDFMRMRQRDLHQAVEEEKVRDVKPEILHQVHSTVQLMVTADNDDDRRSENGDRDSAKSLSVTPIIIGKHEDGYHGKRTRRSIVMSIHDLASIVRKSETVNEEHVCSHCMGSYLDILPDRGSEDELATPRTVPNAPCTECALKQKKIEHLIDSIATMEMKNAKQDNCKRFMPWCG